MVLPGDPPEVGYGCDECGNCHAELENGRHICMSDFTVPSSCDVAMIVWRNGKKHKTIILKNGDEIEFVPMED